MVVLERQIDHEDDEDDEEEEEDDFVTRRRHDSSSDEQEIAPPKRKRYSPSAPNGYARASPPAVGPTSSSHLRPELYASVSGPSHAQASAVRPPSVKPPLEHSILNVEPVDEFIREIADFVHRLVANRTEHVEVEAKIGVLRDDSGQRLRLPIGVETSTYLMEYVAVQLILVSALGPDISGIRFESNMALVSDHFPFRFVCSNLMKQIQHRHYNTLLNKLGSEPPPLESPRTPLKYDHTRLVDSFYPASHGSREKLRVTVDEKTGKVVQCIRKVRLGDLNVYSPKRNADWRISVNLEIPSE